MNDNRIAPSRVNLDKSMSRCRFKTQYRISIDLMRLQIINEFDAIWTNGTVVDDVTTSLSRCDRLV